MKQRYSTLALRRRKKSKQPPLIMSADPAAIYPARTERDNLQTVKQLSPEDVNCKIPLELFFFTWPFG